MSKDPIVEEIRQETPSKLQNLQRRDCIAGDPEDLVHLDWSNE